MNGSTTTANMYQANQPWGTESAISAHLQSQNIPLADIDYSSGDGVVHCASKPFNLSTTTLGNPTFLNAITKDEELKFEHMMDYWTYNQRHESQTILPFLTLGPMAMARNREFLQSAGITMLVVVRNASAVARNPNIMNPARIQAAAGLETTTFDVDGPFDLLNRLRPVIKKMNDHLELQSKGKTIRNVGDVAGNIFVFCETGDSRSAVLVAAYLMVMWGLDATKALQAVQARRCCIGADAEMVNMLKILEDVFIAERQVAAEKGAMVDAANLSLNASKKRDLDEVYSTDTVMADEDLEDLKINLRKGSAPFMDVEDDVQSAV